MAVIAKISRGTAQACRIAGVNNTPSNATTVHACLLYTSIMFDGSHYPIEENIAKTRELVELAHDKGLSIEAEVRCV